MIKKFNSVLWFCCPSCGKKIHPIKIPAMGVMVKCNGKLPSGKKCDWTGEIIALVDR